MTPEYNEKAYSDWYEPPEGFEYLYFRKARKGDWVVDQNGDGVLFRLRLTRDMKSTTWNSEPKHILGMWNVCDCGEVYLQRSVNHKACDKCINKSDILRKL